MKRDKVVELIAAWGKPEILYDVYNNNYEHWADNLLYVLEAEIGMRPPHRAVGPFEANNTWEPTPLQPTPLTEEELADVYINDEDLRKPE